MGKEHAPSAVGEKKHGKSPSLFSSAVSDSQSGNATQLEAVDSEVRLSVHSSSNTFQLSDRRKLWQAL